MVCLASDDEFYRSGLPRLGSEHAAGEEWREVRDGCFVFSFSMIGNERIVIM